MSTDPAPDLTGHRALRGLHARLTRDALSRALCDVPGLITQALWCSLVQLLIGLLSLMGLGALSVGLRGARSLTQPSETLVWTLTLSTVTVAILSVMIASGYAALRACVRAYRRRFWERAPLQLTPARSEAVSDLFYQLLSWTLPMAPGEARDGLRWADEKITLALTLSRDVPRSTRVSFELDLAAEGLRVTLPASAAALWRWRQDRRVDAAQRDEARRVTVTLDVDLEDPASIARVARLAAEVAATTLDEDAPVGEGLTLRAEPTVAASFSPHEARRVALGADPLRAEAPGWLRTRWLDTKRASSWTGHWLLIVFSVLMGAALTLGTGLDGADTVSSVAAAFAVFSSLTGWLLRPPPLLQSARRPVCGAPAAPLWLERDGLTLRLGDAVLDLGAPFNLSVTRAPDAHPRHLRVGVSLTQQRQGALPARLDLLVAVSRRSSVSRLLHHVSVAPVVPAADFAGWVWPMIATAAAEQGHAVPWSFTPAASER